MPIIHPEKESRVYLTDFEVTNYGEFSAESMRHGVFDGIGRVMDSGDMTGLGDESTLIHGFSVEDTSLYSLDQLTASMMRIVGKTVDQTPEALDFLRRALAQFRESFASDRQRLLSDVERTVLVTGIANVRSEWERNQEGWIKDHMINGGFSWIDQCDAVLIEEAFVSNSIIFYLDEAENFLCMMKVLSRPAVLDIIHSLVQDDMTTANDILNTAASALEALVKQADAVKTRYHQYPDRAMLAEATKMLEVADAHWLILESIAEDETPSPTP